MGRYRDDERDYSPFEDDYRGFDVREDDSTRGPLILALAVGSCSSSAQLFGTHIVREFGTTVPVSPA